MDLTGAAGYDDSDEKNRQQMSEGEKQKKKTNKNFTLSVPRVGKIKKEGKNERASLQKKKKNSQNASRLWITMTGDMNTHLYF